MNMQKLHYFNGEQADPTDIFLKMAIGQGYVPETCLLSGQLVMALTKEGRDPRSEERSPRTLCANDDYS